MDCFNSSDPAAVNVTLVFDFDTDNRDLWSRSGPGVPLPPCPSSSSSSPSPSPSSSPHPACDVCLDQIVHIMCRNLSRGVKVMMEAGAEQVKISKSECPKLLSGDAPQWQPPVVIISISIFIFILIVFGVCLYQKCSAVPQEGSEFGPTGEMNYLPSTDEHIMVETEIN